jgi:hypothetical protein
MYLYMARAIPIAMAANKTDVMSIIEMHSARPMNERVLEMRKEIRDMMRRKPANVDSSEAGVAQIHYLVGPRRRLAYVPFLEASLPRVSFQ